MKVLHISARADHGGGPEHIYSLLKHAGPELTQYVASPDDPPYADRFSRLTRGRYCRIPHRQFSIPALARLIRWARAESIDLVHSHGKGAGLYSRALKPFLRVPVVHTFHGLNQDNYSDSKWRLYLALERALCKLSDGLIAVSQSDADEAYARKLASPDKLHIIANGVEIPPRRAAPRRRSGAPVIIAVTRLERQKNPEQLLEIADQLRQRLEGNFSLWIVGDGALLQHCRQLATKRGLADIIQFRGAVDDVRSLLRQADVFLSTSHWEGLPLAPLEAMSEGLPCVLSDVAGHRDLPHSEQWGFLFPPQRSEEAAARLQQLLSDSRQCGRIAESAHEFVRNNYNVRIMAQETTQLYEDLIVREKQP